MAKRGRKPLYDTPIKKSITIPASIMFQIENRYGDKNGQLPYKALSQIVTIALRKLFEGDDQPPLDS